jgi:hypothetical protein
MVCMRALPILIDEMLEQPRCYCNSLLMSRSQVSAAWTMIGCISHQKMYRNTTSTFTLTWLKSTVCRCFFMIETLAATFWVSIFFLYCFVSAMLRVAVGCLCLHAGVWTVFVAEAMKAHRHRIPGGVVHSFTGTMDEMRAFVALDLFIGMLLVFFSVLLVPHARAEIGGTRFR